VRRRVGFVAAVSDRAGRIGRVSLAVVAACGFALLACDHPGGNGVITGTAGTTGTAGNGSPAGTAGTGSGTAGTGVAGTSGVAGDIGTSGTAGSTGDAGASGAAGNVGSAGSGGDTGPGAAGNVGATGTAGSGAAGTSGSAGNSGTAGNVGATGTGGDTGSGGSPGNNLIANGDFSSGATNWHTESGTGNVNGSGAYCVGSPGGATLVGYSAPTGTMLSLSGGYKLTFQASGAGTVHVKIGMAASPYTADYEGNSSIDSGLQTYTHTFTANDNNAGIAFTFMNAGTSTVCLDDIVLVQN
jgi:hypothetical protein